MTQQPFTVEISDEALEDLKARLRAARYAEDFANDDWAYGVNGNYLREIVDYWIEEYDWRAHEAEMNSFSHFRTEVDGVPVHYIREPGVGPNPIPIIMTHGWPWTFWDYKDVIRPLADPGAHGGNPEDAFEVIVASLPGFGFSTPLRTPGINATEVADYWHKLMTEQLGFDRYAAQGGDWGTFTTCQLGHKYGDSLIGLHVSMIPPFEVWNTDRPWVIGGGALMPDDVPADVKAMFLDIERRIASHVSVHMLGPQTLAFALNDSPIGLLSWILERRRHWSGCGGDVEKSFSKDFMLTLISLYWFTESIGTSMRIYAEAGNVPWKPSHDRTPVIEAPLGVSYFAHDVVKGSPATEAQANIVFKKHHEEGGHFAAAERPDAIIEDVRETFRNLR